jgi:hypothetical protein
VARRFVLRLEPYNPDARDADGDGIVQEGTAWERPAGARIVNELGEQIGRGQISSRRKDNFFVVDKDGKPVDYIPTYAKQAKIPTERPKTSLEKRGIQTIKGRGVRNAGEVVTEAVVLSRATSAPPSSPAGEPDPPKVTISANQPSASPTFTRELIADLLPEVDAIKILLPPRKNGVQDASLDVSIVKSSPSQNPLFGWEETDAGKKAMDAVLEAGDRALRALESYLSGSDLSDEQFRELTELHEMVRDTRIDRKRTKEEIKRLKLTAWLDEVKELKGLLMPLGDNESEETVQSYQLFNALIKRIEGRISKVETNSNLELITKGDIEDLEKILNSESQRRLLSKIEEIDKPNIRNWRSDDGRFIDELSYAREARRWWPDESASVVDIADIEGARRSAVIEKIDDLTFDLADRVYDIFPQPRSRRDKQDITTSFFDLSTHTTGRGTGLTAREAREDVIEAISNNRFGDEIDDLYEELSKPVDADSPTARLKEIDPLGDPEKNKQALIELLKTVRSDIGSGDLLNYFNPALIEANGSAAGISGVTKQEMQDMVIETASILPGTWITRFRERYDKPKGRPLKFLRRGHFSSGEIRLSAGQRGWKSVFLHEITHGFEDVVPGLYLMERMFYNRRAQKIGISNIKRKYYGTGQYYYDLQLDNNYTSVYYGDSYLELATMSMEALYAGDLRSMRPDQLRWILGCILTL